jgi:hypothetical protein
MLDLEVEAAGNFSAECSPPVRRDLGDSTVIANDADERAWLRFTEKDRTCRGKT